MKAHIKIPGNRKETVLWIRNTFQDYIEKLLQNQKNVRLAISGGSTPIPLYESFIEDKNWPYWSKIIWYWNDERCVPWNDKESNYGASLPFLEKLSPAELHPMLMDGMSPSLSAKKYANELASNIPLDLVILGVGSDGHIASLFPNHPVFIKQKSAILSDNIETIPLVEAFDVPDKGIRISLSLHVLLSAKAVWIVLLGKEKSKVLSMSLKDTSETLPITLFTKRSNVRFILERDCAIDFEYIS